MVAGCPASRRRTASSRRARTAIREGGRPEPGTGISNQRFTSTPPLPNLNRQPGGSFRTPLQPVPGAGMYPSSR